MVTQKFFIEQTNVNIVCPICKRNTPEQYQEEHHLIPRSIKNRNKYAKLPDTNGTITVCISCGDCLHQLFTEKELADNFRTTESILSNERIQNWIKWIQKKPNDFGICMKTKKSR